MTSYERSYEEQKLLEERSYKETLSEEGYAIASTTITSFWVDGNMDGRERKFLEDSIRMEEKREKKDKNNIPGYISNEIYEPVKVYEKKIKKKDYDETNNIMDVSLNEIISRTTERLNDFDSDFMHILYKVDLKYGYTSNGNGIIKNMMRYLTAFIFYLNDNNNILYVGITMLIISIILYFINIIRK